MKEFAEVYASLPAAGWLSIGEAKLLWGCLQETRGSILEVGAYQGRSTCLLAALGGPVYAVDPFDGFDSDLSGDGVSLLLQRNLAERGLVNNVHIFRQPIEDWPPIPCGLAYLDGEHTYHGTLAQISKAIACDPDIIAVHDCNDDGGGVEVKRAALEMLGPWDVRVERLAVWRYLKCTI